MRIFVKWGRFFINFSHFILPIQIFFVPLHQVTQITIEIMKKVLWLIVCLMTMVIGFTSCESKQNIKERFNLDVSNISENYYGIVENALKSEENFCYFHSKYDLECLKFLKTKIHICTDSLIFGEIYIMLYSCFLY